MAETPQFQNTQPIIQTQKIDSGAESYEVFAKTLGSLAQKSGAKAEELAEGASNSMYLSSMANIDEMKLSAQENILTDPTNAMKYTESLRDNLDKMNKAAYVNKADRQKLEQYSRKTLNATELDAIKTSVKQAQIGAAYEHYANWPAQLNALKDIARSGDKEKLEKYQQSILGHIKSLVSSGAMTPIQGGNAIKSMSDIIEMEQDVHDMIQNVEGHTPANFHSVMLNPIEPNTTNNLHYPVDENTNWLVNHHASDRSFQAAQDDVQNHQFNVRAYENLNSNQRNQLRQQINGIRIADGLINSNASYPHIQSRITQLEGRTDYSSVAERKNLKKYVADIKSGNSEALMARTTIGGKVVRDYVDQQSFLNDKLKNIDPKDADGIGKIKSQIADSKNQYVNNSIAYAQGHHWPVIHPIPQQDVATVENGFNIAGDAAANAATALNTFNQYSKQNQLYFADQMKNPRQRVVMQSISLGKGNSERDNLDFLSANQNHNYTSSDPNTGNPITDDYLKNSVSTAISKSLKIIQAQNDPTSAVILNSSLVQAGVNYAHFLAQKNLQFSKKDGSTFNADKYIANVKSFITNAYQPMTGANYVINKAQNDIDAPQMDAVAQYAINHGNDYLKSGMSESQFIELKNRGDLTVTITPQNILQAKDQNGNIAFSTPMDNNVLAKAESEMKKAKIEKQKELKKFISEMKFIKPPTVPKVITDIAKNVGEKILNTVISPAMGKGSNFIKNNEGFRSKAYKDQKGIWTIGYGHTQGVKKGDTITKEEAHRMYKQDHSIASRAVEKVIKTDLNENQKKALSDLAYNIGANAFARSEVARKVNEGAPREEIEKAFMKFSKITKKVNGKKVKVISKGLKNRRKKNINLFFKE